MEQLMIKRRRRFKQTVPLKDRLQAFASDLRTEASTLPAGNHREELMTSARSADNAANLDEWLHSSGMQSPK